MAGPRAMVVSPTTRVKVPSGALAWMIAGGSRGQSVVTEVGQGGRLVLDALGDPLEPDAVAGHRLVQAALFGTDRLDAGDGIAVRAGGGIVQQHHQPGFDVIGDHVLPPARLGVGLVPVQPDDVHQQALGQTVLAHHPPGQRRAFGRHGDLTRAAGDQIVRLQPIEHLGDRRGRLAQPFGQAGLDHRDALFLQGEDRLQVLLDRRMEAVQHESDPTAGSASAVRSDALLRRPRAGTPVGEGDPTVGGAEDLVAYRRRQPTLIVVTGARGQPGQRGRGR